MKNAMRLVLSARDLVLSTAPCVLLILNSTWMKVVVFPAVRVTALKKLKIVVIAVQSEVIIRRGNKHCGPFFFHFRCLKVVYKVID